MSKFHGIRAAIRLMGVAAVSLLVVFAASAQTVRYIHTDGLGSVVLVTDKDHNVVERSEYEPYGSLLNRPVTDGPGYTGHVMDAATGLTYMQQRYYDPILGRFLSVDAVTAYGGDLRHFNLYDYVFNNPYKFNDRDGRDGELFWAASDQVTVTFKYIMSGVSPSFTPTQLEDQVAKNYSGTVTVNGVNVTVKAQAVQVTTPGKSINTINVVKDTAGVTKSGRSETNAIGGNKITLGATGVDAANQLTASHEIGHGLGAGDQYKGGIDINGKSLPADVPGRANIMKDLTGSNANSQTLGEIIKAPTNVNTCAKGISAASGGC
ncbi:RHS repeat-associated core domain-containing protein [Xanthomonas sp. MUS 060]|uniref:RHS repeat-associated core domain-containing protein n=1 Tax=Xanthomonas sp. MUS 060 TaxID=1588031 RepID=UPI0009E2D790|nr:RHS repeat-associated core domain-containing protein [Xanthomonas sp. MUS 060]